MRPLFATLPPPEGSRATFASRPFGGQVLASNQHQHPDPQPREAASVWEEPDALADIAFAAGVLGVLAGLLAVIRLSGTHFPDSLFWRSLPVLLVVPPALFLG